MQKQNILHAGSSSYSWKSDRGLGTTKTCVLPRWFASSSRVQHSFLRAKTPCISVNIGLDISIKSHKFQLGITKSRAEKNNGELSDDDDDDDLCPVECVREFKTDEEFLHILDKAKETNSLVVVDFYRTSCGSCKYIEQGFAKLCKGSGNEEAPVIFLKHNVIDEYDEQSEVAERLRIKAVPLFHFYKNGILLEAFATRDRERIDAAILKYTYSNYSNSSE